MIVRDMKPAPLPLAVLVDQFPSLSETFILREVEFLEQAGLKPRIYALRRGWPPVVHGNSRDRLADVRFLPVADSCGDLAAAWRVLRTRDPARARRWLGRMLATGCRAPRMLVRVFRRLPAVAAVGLEALDGAIGYCHAHFASLPTEVAWAAAVYSGRRFGFATHARDIFTQSRTLLRIKMSAASLVTACTATHLNFLKQCVPPSLHSRLELFYHGTVIPAASSAPPKPRCGHILAVGRLVPKKAFDVLLSACALMAERGVDYTCELVGVGPEGSRLEDMVRRLDIGSRVRLTGALSQECLPETYARASLAVVATRVMPDGDRDGIPNVLLEAMARGLPVVATDTPSIREVVKEGLNGVLVPSEDPAALAEALAKLLGDSRRRRLLGQRAAADVRARFDAAFHGRCLAERLRAVAAG